MENSISNHYDAHSHSPGNNAVFNVDYKFAVQLPIFNSIQLISLGAHPWYIDNFDLKDFIGVFERLKKRSDIKIVAIGEIGLDRKRGGSFEKQLEYFNHLIRFSAQINLPVILHCVSALEEILFSLKKFSFPKSCMFHDFNGNQIMLKKLIDLGHYVGVGNSLKRKNSKIYQQLNNLDIQHILFETDESSLRIEDIYDSYIELTNKPKNLVHSKIENNFRIFFELP